MRFYPVRITALSIALCLLLLPFAVQAETKGRKVHHPDVIWGTVVSVDQASRSVVIKNDKNGQDLTVTASEKVISSLKAGERVKVVKKGKSSVADKIIVIKASPKK